MKNNSFLVVLMLMLPLLFPLNEDKIIYARNVKGEIQVVNSSEKSIIILTSAIECSGCESYLNSYLQNNLISDSIDIIIITQYSSNTIVRRQKYDHFAQKFSVSNKVLFMDDSDMICDVKYSSFSLSDYPVILLMNSKEHYCKWYKYNKFANENTGRLKYSKKFHSDFLEFQE